jgi:hypothetical protein
VEWAVDYFDNILVPLDNFINRDTETFLSDPKYIVSVMEMASKVLTRYTPGYRAAPCFPTYALMVSSGQLSAQRLDSSRRSSRSDVMESDMVPACKLMEIVMQNCRGRVDEQIGPFMDLALGRLRLAENNRLKDYCMEV